MTDRTTGDHLYIHVPFCVQKCGYCAFYSVVDRDDALLDRYVEALLRELELRKSGDERWSTVYFGGGTPSLLGSGRVARLMEAIAPAGDAEVTLEANPETVTEELLVGLREVGVNRLSLGIQSLAEDELRYLGRIHDSSRARRALELVQSDFERVSIDLIYGLPGQTVAGWLTQLEQAVLLGAEHLSAYELTYEPGTPLGNVEGRTPDRTEFFFATHERLDELGMEGYEVSNFGRSAAARSRHNLATWAYRPYVGLGPGAHSFSGPGAGAERRWNAPDLDRYLQAAGSDRIPHSTESLTAEQQLLERLMLGLRTSVGVSGAALPLSDETFRGRLVTAAERGLLRHEGGFVRPTLKGMGLADGLADQLVG